MMKPLVAALVMACAVVAMSPPASAAEEATPVKIGTETGEMLPDFILPSLDSGYGRLSDYRGKKVLVFHFASW